MAGPHGARSAADSSPKTAPRRGAACVFFSLESLRVKRILKMRSTLENILTRGKEIARESVLLHKENAVTSLDCPQNATVSK